jgi:hypothetical protein
MIKVLEIRERKAFIHNKLQKEMMLISYIKNFSYHCSILEVLHKRRCLTYMCNKFFTTNLPIITTNL